MWPTDQHGIVQRDVALARGISTRHVDDAVRSGALILLARGRYLPREVLADVDAPRDELYRAWTWGAGCGEIFARRR